MNRRLTAHACRFALAMVLIAASPVLAQPAAVQASSRPTTIPRAGTIRPAALRPSTPAAPHGHIVYPLRTLDPSALNIAKQRAAGAPSASGPLVVATALTTGLYNNTNQQGIGAGDEFYCCVPPDTTDAIGPTRYVEIVNEFVRVYDRSLNRISDTGMEMLGIRRGWAGLR